MRRSFAQQPATSPPPILTITMTRTASKTVETCTGRIAKSSEKCHTRRACSQGWLRLMETHPRKKIHTLHHTLSAVRSATNLVLITIITLQRSSMLLQPRQQRPQWKRTMPRSRWMAQSIASTASSSKYRSLRAAKTCKYRIRPKSRSSYRARTEWTSR